MSRVSEIRQFNESLKLYQETGLKQFLNFAKMLAIRVGFRIYTVKGKTYVVKD